MTLDTLIGKEITLVGYINPFASSMLIEGRCAFVVFIYDNIEYIMKVNEDPEDGYRSSLGIVEFVDNTDVDYKKGVLIKTAPAKLILKLVKEVYHITYSFINENGTAWIEFGTDNCDDYYPSFFFSKNEVCEKEYRSIMLRTLLDE